MAETDTTSLLSGSGISDTDGTDITSAEEQEEDEEDTPYTVVMGVKSTEKFSVPEKYKKIWQGWAQTHGMVKIKPEVKIGYNHKVTKGNVMGEDDSSTIKTSVTYLNNANDSQPVTQVIPIQNVDVTPHMSTFEFFDTTEGRIGISKAGFQHMVVTFDVTVSAFLLYYYNYQNYAKEYSNSSQWMGLQKLSQINENSLIDWETAEKDALFLRIRQRFLQEYSAWACTFSSTAFGTFQGVISEMQYKIEEGDTDAVYSLQVEEVVLPDSLKSTKNAAAMTAESEHTSANTNLGMTDIISSTLTKNTQEQQMKEIEQAAKNTSLFNNTFVGYEDEEIDLNANMDVNIQTINDILGNKTKLAD